MSNAYEGWYEVMVRGFRCRRSESVYSGNDLDEAIRIASEIDAAPKSRIYVIRFDYDGRAIACVTEGAYTICLGGRPSPYRIVA